MSIKKFENFKEESLKESVDANKDRIIQILNDIKEATASASEKPESPMAKQVWGLCDEAINLLK